MTTRITGGEHRGRKLRAARVPRMRPTSEKVRAAIFSMIGQATVAGGRVLDLYAGSGALGIEALSRGANWVDFVEQDSRLCRSIRQSLDELGLADRARVHRRSVEAALGKLKAKYDVVFADAPYDDDPWAELMEKLERFELLVDRALIVLEHHRRLDLEQSYGRIVRSRARRHGDTVVSIYEFESDNG
jgi:16S rRNA (guanine966-N2)-methyltransferase